MAGRKSAPNSTARAARPIGNVSIRLAMAVLRARPVMWCFPRSVSTAPARAGRGHAASWTPRYLYGSAALQSFPAVGVPAAAAFQAVGLQALLVQAVPIRGLVRLVPLSRSQPG